MAAGHVPHVYTNGIVTFYEDARPQGRVDVPTVVLIHGYSVDLRLWDDTVPPLLEGGFRVVRYDVRGHGRSLVPPNGYDFPTYAADLSDLLDRLNVDRPISEELAVGEVHLVGLSMGGGIALQFALEHPRRVRSLTLVDSALPGFTYSPQFVAQIEQLVEMARSQGPRAALEQVWLQHPIFDGVRRYPERFARLREMVLAFPGRDLLAEPSPPPSVQVVERLANVGAPTLVLVGELDLPDFHLAAQVLAANLPRARLQVLPDCGHVPPLERPEEFNRALLEFLLEAEGRI
ncbi:MAG TPA: alpha/beta hydrolase [Dehalococcoidia bacterium]|nr:alpha/beta hydrolase [Dehalococcoidia bacterium]